jgi:TonB family protein
MRRIVGILVLIVISSMGVSNIVSLETGAESLRSGAPLPENMVSVIRNADRVTRQSVAPYWQQLEHTYHYGDGALGRWPTISEEELVCAADSAVLSTVLLDPKAFTKEGYECTTWYTARFNFFADDLVVRALLGPCPYVTVVFGDSIETSRTFAKETNDILYKVFEWSSEVSMPVGEVTAPVRPDPFRFDTPPVLIEYFDPVYPTEAKDKHIEGTVAVKVLVGLDGTVEKVAIVESPNPLLDSAAIAAARKLLFRPAELDGDPRRAYVMVPFQFQLDK